MEVMAQKLAIAEACGTDKHVYPHGDPVTKHHAPLPDYPNDRNATWKAAEQLGEPIIKAMRYWLFTICGEMKAHHATAAQECEAIVRALGKWTE